MSGSAEVPLCRRSRGRGPALFSFSQNYTDRIRHTDIPRPNYTGEQKVKEEVQSAACLACCPARGRAYGWQHSADMERPRGSGSRLGCSSWSPSLHLVHQSPRPATNLPARGPGCPSLLASRSRRQRKSLLEAIASTHIVSGSPSDRAPRPLAAAARPAFPLAASPLTGCCTAPGRVA